MALHLLDTNIVIDISKDIEPATSMVRQLMVSGHGTGIIDVIVAEFFSGIQPADRGRWETFVQAYDFWETTYNAAVRAGEYRYFYARRGISISTQDSLIAAVAVEMGAILVTNNARDFPMPNLPLLIPAQSDSSEQ